MRIDESFNWFTGVVEDRNDPEKLNRVRVRVFGSHTNKKQDLATADLPWATVMMPTTSSSNSGLGQTLHGLVEGSWVVGFWKDGNSQQDPMIIGSFVGLVGENIKKKSVAEWGQYHETGKFGIMEQQTIKIEDPDGNIITKTLKSAQEKGKKGPVSKLTPTDVRISGDIVHGKKYEISPVETSGEGSGLRIQILSHEKKISSSIKPSWWVGDFFADHPDIGKPYNAMSSKVIQDDGINYEEGDTVYFQVDTYNESEIDKIVSAASAEAAKLTPPLSFTELSKLTSAARTEAESKQFFFTWTVSDIYGDEVPEGFLDPRLQTVKQYDKTPEGPKPVHNPSRGTGLTLALDKSPKSYGLDDILPGNYPREEYKNESDVNKLARQDGKYNQLIWPNNMIEEGGRGKTLFSGVNLERGGGNSEDRSKWVKPKYPFNHVYESESGHVIEIDDTPGYERINLFHRKGARVEINNKGEIHIVAAPGQDLNLQGGNVNIQDTGSGSLNINADCEVNILAKVEAKITSKGPTTIISTGITKLFSMASTKIASLGKNIIG